MTEVVERAAIVAWLRRRASLYQGVSWWRPLKRYRWRTGVGTFLAAAELIERGAHLARTLADETAIINQAIEPCSPTPITGDQT